jgi:hypothetical protein
MRSRSLQHITEHQKPQAILRRIETEHAVTRSFAPAAAIWISVLIAACEPVIGVKVSDEPIVINLNVNINHDIRIRLDREAEELFEERKDIF